jgi:hypothetical protein
MPTLDTISPGAVARVCLAPVRAAVADLLGTRRRWCRDTGRQLHGLAAEAVLDHHGIAQVAIVLDGTVLLLDPLKVGWLRHQLCAALVDAAIYNEADHAVREVTE